MRASAACILAGLFIGTTAAYVLFRSLYEGVHELVPGAAAAYVLGIVLVHIGARRYIETMEPAAW